MQQVDIYAIFGLVLEVVTTHWWQQFYSLEISHRKRGYSLGPRYQSAPEALPINFLFFSFLSFFLSYFMIYRHAALSSRAVDGHQIYSGGSVVGKASTIGRPIDIFPHISSFSQCVKT